MNHVRVGKSKIAGKGLFATRDLHLGEFITTMKGRLIYRNYQKPADYKGENNFVPVALNWWINPIGSIRYINHSCNPNSGFKTPRRLYALRDIKEGEEITLDYSTIEYVDFWSMPCSCGAANCRKVVHSIQFISRAKFKRYLPFIPLFMQRVYSLSHLEYKIR